MTCIQTYNYCMHVYIYMGGGQVQLVCFYSILTLHMTVYKEHGMVAFSDSSGYRDCSIAYNASTSGMKNHSNLEAFDSTVAVEEVEEVRVGELEVLM